MNSAESNHLFTQVLMQYCVVLVVPHGFERMKQQSAKQLYTRNVAATITISRPLETNWLFKLENYRTPPSSSELVFVHCCVALRTNMALLVGNRHITDCVYKWRTTKQVTLHIPLPNNNKHIWHACLAFHQTETLIIIMNLLYFHELSLRIDWHRPRYRTKIVSIDQLIFSMKREHASNKMSIVSGMKGG